VGYIKSIEYFQTNTSAFLVIFDVFFFIFKLKVFKKSNCFCLSLELFPVILKRKKSLIKKIIILKNTNLIYKNFNFKNKN